MLNFVKKNEMTSFILNIDETSKLGKSVLRFLREMEGNEITLKALDQYIEQLEDKALGEIMLKEMTGEYAKEEEVLKKLNE